MGRLCPQAASLATLPNEILEQIVKRLPVEPAQLECVGSVCKRLASLVYLNHGFAVRHARWQQRGKRRVRVSPDFALLPLGYKLALVSLLLGDNRMRDLTAEAWPRLDARAAVTLLRRLASHRDLYSCAASSARLLQQPTLLSWCCERGFEDAARELVQTHGSNPRANQSQPLRMAAKAGLEQLVRFLLPQSDPNADPDYSPLGYASSRGHARILALLLQDDRIDPAEMDNKPIKLASEAGHTDCILHLLHASPQVDPSVDDNYCIRTACTNGHVGAVRVLLADPRVHPAARESAAFLWACGNGHVEVVRLLLADARVDTASQYHGGFREAARRGHLSVVRLLLLDFGLVDPAVEDNYALKWACNNGHVEVARLLLADARTDPAAEASLGLKGAAENGHAEVVQLLLEDGRVDATAGGNFAARYAFRRRHLDVVALLEAFDPRVAALGYQRDEEADGWTGVKW
ncbi:ankyrin repeat-containing domain protein [Chytriomyces sp. MP71]|nr:ankyrin repeat-containing domain protein [Chytriomyces sp. MP71]